MKPWDRIAVGALAVGFVALLVLVPAAAWSTPALPETGGVYGSVLLVAGLVALRLLRRPRLERLALALFLAGMPVIYVESALLHGSPLGVELLGLALFAGLALGGMLRTPWLLVAGIVGHGLAWDLWHLDRAGTVPGWYAIGCAVIDVAVGGYAAARILAGAWPVSGPRQSPPRPR